MGHIHIIQGDITKAEVDVIVNAANPAMLGGGGVDGAIHRAAGPELKEACLDVEAINGVRCPSGQARITSAGKLPSRYVIHTVGPVYIQSHQPAAVLASAYFNSLRLAVKNGCQSIAFPAISCGVYGYPHREAAAVALRVCSKEEFKDLMIDFYLFDQDMVETWKSVPQLVR